MEKTVFTKLNLDCGSRLLEATGFKEFVVRVALESYNPNWSSYNLDMEPDGDICMPDALFVEAIKA